MWTTGNAYGSGCGVERSGRDALFYFMKAGEKGHLLAMCFAAVFSFSVGGDLDGCMRGIAWWHKAADAGCVVAIDLMARTAEALGRTQLAKLHRKKAAAIAKLEGKTVEQIIAESVVPDPNIAALLACGESVTNALLA